MGEYRDKLALARLDHRISDSQWLSLRLNGQRETNNNPNDRVGGLTQPSAAVWSTGQSLGSQLTHTVTKGAWVNEFRAGYTNAVPSATTPIEPQVGIVRQGYSTEGTSSFSFVRTEIYQAANQFGLHHGAHSLKFGGDFIRRKVRDRSFDLFGSYTFAGAPVPGEAPLQFTQVGVADLSYGQTQWLTLHLGLRYDYQSLLDDYNNLGPRFGFSWDALGTGGTVVRGGYGMFYDQPFFHGLTQRFLLNGLTVPFASYTFTAADPAFPVFRTPLTHSARRPAGPWVRATWCYAGTGC
jgi:hypothetical protein